MSNSLDLRVAGRLDDSADPGRLWRQGLLGLAVLGSLSGLAELATLRHWNDRTQLMPWAVLALVALLALAVLIRPTRSVLTAARPVAVLSVLAAGFGIFEHVKANYDTAPLDRVWGPAWDSMSFTARLWRAIDGSVGPSPLLAPGLLAQAGLGLVLATIGHPTNRRVLAAGPSAGSSELGEAAGGQRGEDHQDGHRPQE